MAVWWAARVECISALARRSREGVLGTTGEEHARRALGMLAGSWSEILPTDRLRTLAERLLAVHPIRAADALQLAAALQWCAGEPIGRPFVCLDQRLREAARREGFVLLPGADQAKQPSGG